MVTSAAMESTIVYDYGGIRLACEVDGCEWRRDADQSEPDLAQLIALAEAHHQAMHAEPQWAPAPRPAEPQLDLVRPNPAALSEDPWAPYSLMIFAVVVALIAGALIMGAIS